MFGHSLEFSKQHIAAFEQFLDDDLHFGHAFLAYLVVGLEHRFIVLSEIDLEAIFLDWPISTLVELISALVFGQFLQ